MYVDDTNITTSGSSLNNIIYSVDRDLISIRDWLLANKLSLNVSKTEQLFIASDSNLSKIACAPQIFMDGKPIERVRSMVAYACHSKITYVSTFFPIYFEFFFYILLI